jgi:hypothetical protein
LDSKIHDNCRKLFRFVRIRTSGFSPADDLETRAVIVVSKFTINCQNMLDV